MSRSGSFSESINTPSTPSGFLAVDMVQKANSGIPELPWDRPPWPILLWTRHLRHESSRSRPGPTAIASFSRRPCFGPALCSAPPERLRPASRRAAPNFRQLHSKTPGHPGDTASRRASRPPPDPSVKGSALPSAWRSPSVCWLPLQPPRAPTLIDHRVWAIAGDGDMMEGVASEACSLAGHQRLGQSQRPLRRQRDLDRRADLALFLRRRRQTLRGLRLAHPAAGRGRQRPRGTGCRDDGGRGRPKNGRR